MFEGFDFEKMMGQMKDMQSKMQDMQSDISTIKVIGEAGATAEEKVRVIMNGGREIEKVLIPPALLNVSKKNMLQDLITAACNNAAEKLEDEMKGKMGDISSMFNLPKDLKLPFGDDEDVTTEEKKKIEDKDDKEE